MSGWGLGVGDLRRSATSSHAWLPADSQLCLGSGRPGTLHLASQAVPTQPRRQHLQPQCSPAVSRVRAQQKAALPVTRIPTAPLIALRPPFPKKGSTCAAACGSCTRPRGCPSSWCPRAWRRRPSCRASTSAPVRRGAAFRDTQLQQRHRPCPRPAHLSVSASIRRPPVPSFLPTTDQQAAALTAHPRQPPIPKP
jgi:hypothetical protein